jgi:hypothetical protein
MAKIKIIWIIGIFILIPEFCLAQFSREQAKNFVFNQNDMSDGGWLLGFNIVVRF